ncbi:YcgL domain-containing protein, partial [Escherichia sp. TWPC-MK]
MSSHKYTGRKQRRTPEIEVSKRDQTYLYVEKKDDFSRVPEELMK